MKTENWINGMDVLFLSKKDRDYWDKLCKEVEEGKVPAITLRGVKYDLARHGKWIKENIVLTSLPPQYRWHCSECGSFKEGYDESILTPYCSNCGARMDEQE